MQHAFVMVVTAMLSLLPLTVTWAQGGGDAGAVTAGDQVAQATAVPAYQDKCASCHGDLAQFAKRDLLLSDGELTGRKSKQSVRQYLARHGRLRPDEIPAVVEALSQALAKPLR